MARVITKSEGRLDMANIGVRRKVEINQKELASFYQEHLKTAVPIESIDPETEASKFLVFKGKQNELIWEASVPQPEFLTDITTELRAVFSLKKEIKDFSVRIFPPATVASSKVTTIVKVPMELAIVITSRIIVTIGSDEMLELYANTGQKGAPSGKGSFKLQNGWAYMTPMCAASGIDFSWDDSTSISEAPRKGFRAKPSGKYPTRRYMLVIDCLSDQEVMMEAIKGKAKSMTANSQDAAKVTSILSDALNMDRNIDAVAAAAAAISTNDHEIPDLVPIEKDVDIVAAMAAKMSLPEVALD